MSITSPIFGVEASDEAPVSDRPGGMPSTFPPHPFATRNWADKTRRKALAIEDKFGAVCSTNEGHGRTGEPWGIDVRVAPRTTKAYKAQEGYGDEIQLWVERHWDERSINYMIWWNWMIDNEPNPALLNRGWFYFEPYAFQGTSGPGQSNDPNDVVGFKTSRSLNDKKYATMWYPKQAVNDSLEAAVQFLDGVSSSTA
jgi:hypothetical protein